MKVINYVPFHIQIMFISFLSDVVQHGACERKTNQLNYFIGMKKKACIKLFSKYKKNKSHQESRHEGNSSPFHIQTMIISFLSDRLQHGAFERKQNN